MNLPAAIQELRTRRGESQQVFATRQNIAIRTLSNYETGIRRPPREFLTALFDIATKIGDNTLADVFRLAIDESVSISEAIDEEQQRFLVISRPARSGKRFYALLWVTDDEFEIKALYGLTSNLEGLRDPNPAIRKNSERALQELIDAGNRKEHLSERARSKKGK